MRARYAAFALSLLVVLGLAAAVAVRSGGGPPPAAAPDVTATAAAATATTAPTPTATATAPPTATPTPTATAAAAPAPKRYNRLDATGEAATAGSWAILGADGGVLTTWEALRGEAATLRLHQTDAGGASQADAYGSVEAGGIVEWRKADDCWVRYRVTAAPTRPASGSSRWEFPVEWITYAGTGAGCTGTVATTDTLTVDEAPVPVTSHAVATPSRVALSPVRHGPYLIYPVGWSGVIETPVPVSGQGDTQSPVLSLSTSDLTEARRHPLWLHDPALPSGWTLDYMAAPVEGRNGYYAMYRSPRGYVGAYIYVSRHDKVPIIDIAYRNGSVRELLAIDGHPAILMYSPTGQRSSRVRVFVESSSVEYYVVGSHPILQGDIAATIEVARSLYGRAGQ